MTRSRPTLTPEQRDAKQRALIDSLERGFQDVRDGERYQRYLATCARFHNYSIGNQMLIMLQRPDASRVAGFHTWLSLGRHVRKGEKGIAILAPQTYRKRSEDDDDDSDGETHLFFRTVHVFDVSQTDGDALPTLVDHLTGDDAGLYAALLAVAHAETLTVDRRPGQHPTANGFYARRERRIWVSPALAPAMAAKTLAHELAHHFAEHETNGHCRDAAETIAESVAFIVLAHYGIDASGYSFGYLAAWSEAKTFKAALREINKVSAGLIERLTANGSAPTGETEGRAA